ncbi:MAG: ABC transporter substrate-binding protein [Melioribacteraceae bacterium]|nr:MAG: ABC transporter substrate-binding protein [Melioribacteraceae bacterium]
MEKIISSFLICLLFVMLNSCSNNKKENSVGKTEIVFWHSFVSSTIPALNELISKFENEHPDIKITAQYIPTGDALIQKLITAVQSKTAPDISWLHADYMEDLVDADAIFKMEYFINGENGITDEELKKIYPALLQYSSWKGELYSLPMEATNLALIYNKDMFKEVGLDPERPPQTWDELKEYSAKLTLDKNNDGNFERIGFFIPNYPAAGPLGNWMVWQFLPYIWQAGGFVITEDQSKVIYNDAPGVNALTLWKELYQSQKLNKFTNDYDIAFASQRLAMAMDGPWNLPRYEEIVKDFNYGFAFLPEGPVKRATVVGGEYLAIFKQSKHPEAAWTFLKWMISPEAQAEWSMLSKYLPIRKDVVEIPKYKKYLDEHPHFKVFFEQMDYSQAQRPIDFGGLQIARHIAQALEESMLGNKDPKKALDEAAQKSNLVLKPRANR